MKKLILGIILLMLFIILGYKIKTDIDKVTEHNKMNIEQVDACSEYLKQNPDGVCD